MIAVSVAFKTLDKNPNIKYKEVDMLLVEI